MSSDVVQGVNRGWAETPPVNPPLRHAIGEVVERQTWLDKLANPVQNWLLAFFGQPGQPNRKMKDMLNGTWLGHSLHPVLLNGSIAILNLASLVLRLRGKRHAGVALSTTGYVVSLFSAYLGGELVFAKGIGVNHVAWEGGSDDFVAIMDERDLVEGKLTRVDVSGIPAVLLKQGQSIYAIGATCTHLAGPLDEGTVEDGVVQCPWHGSRFCMRDGSVVNGPAVYAAPTFAVRLRNGKVELRRLDHA
ncbi:MAG: Rieske 2Fe-2S domain-containing protein [Chloroflexi bacterium]|nr:MAG: Rieske 2Fe-2S domain-containing protein [Chloroflexota bacterium]